MHQEYQNDNNIIINTSQAQKVALEQQKEMKNNGTLKWLGEEISEK